MGFDVYWSLHRARPLDERERAVAAAHVVRWRNVIDGYDLELPAGADPTELIAWGTLRPSHGAMAIGPSRLPARGRRARPRRPDRAARPGPRR